MSNIALTLIFLTLFPASAFAAARWSFWISTESPELKVNLHVTDPRGIKAGHLEDGSSTATNLGGGYGIDRIDDDVDGSLGHASMEINVFGGIYVGTYTATLYGLDDTGYVLGIDYDPNPGRRTVSRQEGFISAGAVRTYSMVVTDPNQPPVLVKNATFATLRQDLTIASRIHQLPPGDTSKFQIGDAKFVAKLDKTLTEGEKALSKKDDGKREGNKEAITKLGEFIRKLGKAFKGDKDDDRDKDSGKDHDKKPTEDEHEKTAKLFVSETAYKTLKSDAETLIAALGGKSSDDHDRGNRDNDKGSGNKHGR